MNDSLDKWLDTCPRWYALPMYQGLAKSRERFAEKFTAEGDLAQAAKCQEAASFYAERARVIGALLRAA